MTRYQALRAMKCDPLTAGVIAFGNWMRGIRPGLIVFLTAEIEYEVGPAPCVDPCPYLGYCVEEGLCSSGCEVRQRINDTRGVPSSSSDQQEKRDGR